MDFAEVEALQAAGSWDEAALVLGRVAQSLEVASADFLLLHLGGVTASAVRAAGLTRVGLLGTAFTTEQDFYVERLKADGLDVVVLPAEDRAVVHRVIYEELCLGVVRQEPRTAYQQVIARFVAVGAEGIILGCTEIELLGPAAEVPLFPTTRLHIEAAVDRALADS